MIKANKNAMTADAGEVPDPAPSEEGDQGAPFIGLLGDLVTTTPHTVDLIRGAHSEAVARKYHLLVGNLDDDPDAGVDYWEMFASHQATGVIYATMHRREIIDQLPDINTHIVLANCHLSGEEEYSILPDDLKGGSIQARHLLDLGHTRIAVISLSRDASASHLRNEGIEWEMATRGINPDPALWDFGIDGVPGNETYVAYEIAQRMLSLPDSPTAIICGNDRVAMLVYCAAASLGIDIPRDLSVVGFDDFQTISLGVRPTLTTVELPYFEMGRRAVRAVLAGPDAENVYEPVPCRLIARESSAPPRKV